MVVEQQRRNGKMPVISRFYGIVIKMYLRQKEHNPPHIHAIYTRAKIFKKFYSKK